MSDQDWRLRRKDNRAEITLPQDMRWADEFDWTKTAQAEPQRTLSGGLVIQQGIKQNGRPVTLAGDWVYRFARLNTETQYMMIAADHKKQYEPVGYDYITPVTGQP